eukprot:s590_g38.t1
MALGNAIQLRGEVLFDPSSCLWSSSSLMSLTPSRLTPPSLTSRLKRFPSFTVKNVTFESTIEVISGNDRYHVEPLSVIAEETLDYDIDDFSLMARAPRQAPPSSEGSIDSDFNIDPPSSPASVGHGRLWQSVQLYDLHGNVVGGRVQVQPPEAAFVDARRLLGYTHHEVAAIFNIVPKPRDLAYAHVEPSILLKHDDLTFGDTRRAVLFDVELHGNTFESPIETDRYTSLIPGTVNRQYLLRIAGVKAYCNVQQDRCLLWLRGNLVPHQGTANLEILHGDYIRIAVPPFENPLVPTHFAVRACQEGFTREQVVHHYQQFGSDDESLRTAVTNAQEDRIEQLQDELGLQGLLQTSLEIAAQPTALTRSMKIDQQEEQWPLQCSLTDEIIEAVRAAQHAPEPDGLPEVPADIIDRHPAFIRQLHDLFTADLRLTHNQNPPSRRVETWFTDHLHHKTCHMTRIVTLDDHFEQWEQLIKQTWADVINPFTEIEIFLVHPLPEDADTGARTQLLLVQQPVQNLASVVITIYDSAYDEGKPHSCATTVPNRFGLTALTHAVEFEELCPPLAPTHECTMWFGELQIRPYQLVATRHGYAFKLRVRRPREFELSRSMTTAELRDVLNQALADAATFEHQPTSSTSSQTGTHLPLEVIMPIDDDWRPEWHDSISSLFISSPSASPLTISTWFLEGHAAPRCILPRLINLHDTPDMWESLIISAWEDHVDLMQPVFIHFVDPSPPTASSHFPAGHILIVQRPLSHHAAFLLTEFWPGTEQPVRGHVAIYSADRLSFHSAILALPSSTTPTDQQKVVVRRGRLHFPVEGAPRIGDGDSIVVEMHPRHSHPRDDAHDGEEDQHSLLQTSSESPTVKQTQTTGNDPQPSITLHCSPTAFLEPRPVTQAPFRASWTTSLHSTFIGNARTEYADEGPVAYVDTWYLRGYRPYTTALSRTWRIDQFIQYWHEELIQLWRDVIDDGLPVYIYWVHPTPGALAEQERIGHIILQQEPHRDLTPVLFTVHFEGRLGDAFCFNAALVNNPVNFFDARDLLGLARHCLVRRCELLFRDHIWQPLEDQAVDPGTNLVFKLDTPIESHWR